MRQMSFALTTEQMLSRTKTVTRRLGWATLKPGTVLQAVEKSQGLGKGGKVRRLHQIRVVDVRREPLFYITSEDVAREGFPRMSRDDFIAMFCKHMRCEKEEHVTRIEFEHLAGPEAER